MDLGTEGKRILARMHGGDEESSKPGMTPGGCRRLDG